MGAILRQLFGCLVYALSNGISIEICFFDAFEDNTDMDRKWLVLLKNLSNNIRELTILVESLDKIAYTTADLENFISELPKEIHVQVCK